MKDKTYVLKITDACNMNCSYCYISEENKNKYNYMPDSVINKFFERLELESEENIRLVWHGGEPLLRGRAFFENILERENESSLKFKNNIQTNGLLLSDEFLDFFIKNNFGVGISFDGPREISDLTRFSKGKSVYDLVCSAIKKSAKYRQFGLVTVITKYHLGKEKELIKEYESLGIENVKLNPFFASGKGANKSEELGVSHEELAKFFVNFYDLWMSDKETDLNVKPLDSLILAAMGFKPTLCVFRERDCYTNYLELNPNGDIYPCGKYAGIDSCKLGNIYSDSLEKCMDKKTKLGLERAELVKNYGILGRGCLFDSYLNDGESGYINAYEAVVKHIKKDLTAKGII